MSVSDSDSLSLANLPMPEWYVFRVRPRHEKLVALQLAQQNIRCFLPVSRQNRYWAKRLTIVELPIFPGFVFAAVQQTGIAPVLATRGVIEIVRQGSTPGVVPQTEMNAIERVGRSTASIERGPFLPSAERVMVLEGPFAGLTGSILRNGGSEKLLLSVTLLQSSIQVEVSQYAFTALEGQYASTTIESCTADVF